jgi:PAS domain S-box-containing protein
MASLAGAALLVVLVIAVSFSTFKQVEEEAAARKHTFIILISAADLLSSLKDAETSQRGYLLTGEESFLQPYLAVRNHIDDQLNELRLLSLISAAHQHLEAMSPLIDAKLAELSHTIELRRNRDMATALIVVRTGQGKQLMDSIRVEMSSFIKLEEDALNQHEEKFQSNMRLLFAFIVIISLFTLLFTLAFAYFIYRETQQRLEKAALRETQHLLEMKEASNQQLQQANATLQISEEKLAVTLNSIGDAVIATDAEGRVTLINPLAAQLTGWTELSAISRTVDEIFNIINKDTRLPATIPVKNTLALGTIHGLANHTVLIARDGSESDIADSCAPIRDRDGQVIGAVLVFRDVTGEYAAQQVLKEKHVELGLAKSVAEKANLAKSEFLSSMSHELRSPLNAILGFAQLMESDIPPPSPIQMESIGLILQSGWHLLTLINEVLDLAKVESGHAPLSHEPVSLAEVILECRKMIELQAQQRGIHLEFPTFEKSYFINADRTRVKQILINLLSNAIKYNTLQGTVEVKCTEIVPGRIRVSIRDTGAGLTPEKLEQLFQAFNRLGQEAGGEEGTGIGLVVAKRLVELMGGIIGVESTVGIGSMFWFEFVAIDEPSISVKDIDAAILAQPRIPREARQHTVLYVEDNPTNLQLVKKIIARQPNISLLTAVDGYSGIEIAQVSQPDVILMDINMPGMNGFEALKLLQADPTTAHITVLALTANAMPRDIKHGIEAGFFRYITKPIMVNELLEALNVALEFAETGRSQRKEGWS